MSHLYVSDLDGTLLSNNGTLSNNSRAALQQLLSDGVAFSVASARSVVSIKPILSGIRLSLPVIEFNGAFLSDLDSGRHEQLALVGTCEGKPHTTAWERGRDRKPHCRLCQSDGQFSGRCLPIRHGLSLRSRSQGRCTVKRI